MAPRLGATWPPTAAELASIAWRISWQRVGSSLRSSAFTSAGDAICEMIMPRDPPSACIERRAPSGTAVTYPLSHKSPRNVWRECERCSSAGLISNKPAGERCNRCLEKTWCAKAEMHERRESRPGRRGRREGRWSRRRPPVRFGTVSGVSRFRNERCSSGVSRDVTFYPERANSSQTIVRKTPTNPLRAGRPHARPRESNRSAPPKMSRRKNRVNDEVCSTTRALRPASRHVDGHIDDRQYASRPEGLKGTGGHDGLSLVHVAPRPGKP